MPDASSIELIVVHALSEKLDPKTSKGSDVKVASLQHQAC
jgi:hypothetical protein